MIDLRIIDLSPPRVGVERDGISQLIYDVVWPQSAVLRGQARLHAMIQEEGYDLFPDDVDARLRWFAERHRQATDPALFSVASETTRFCNGVALTTPIHDGGVFLYVPTERRDEFVALFAEELSARCDPASVPQG